MSKRWRAASEEAMSYEWTMGDKIGTVQECIGFKCPSTPGGDQDARKDGIITGVSERDACSCD